MDTLERVQFCLHGLGLTKSDITPDAKLLGDLGMDSLDAVEMAMVLEEEFDVEVPDEYRPDETTTVSDLAHYVNNLLQMKTFQEED